MALARWEKRGDIGGGQPTPPTVPSVQHAVTVEVSERAALEHSVVQEWGGSEATAIVGGGGKGGHL